ncbi:hypothetical protein [Marinobacterium stanieri]|uniref:hypothetical protein n=1 Tax=Marinobacterium stanieri TaxID=49186 RepID=UPI00025598EF|nr:hypothetical protein [Marinobacterium stanieri]
MSNSNESLSTVELARLSGVDDAVALAKIERAEHVAEMLNAAGSWIKQVVVSAAGSVSHAVHNVFTRHAH